MALTEKQREIALRVGRDVAQTMQLNDPDGFLEFASRFLAALPKPEPVAWATANEDGDYAMLFFDKQEARSYSGDDQPVGLVPVSLGEARADPVAENERLRDEDDARYIHSCGPKCMRAGCVNRRLHTALAAAEAREMQLCKAIVLFRNEKAVGQAGSVRATEGYAAMQYAVFDQPHDDSALREMIAGVYEECVQACKQFQGPHRAMTFNDELERCVYAIRALAEKVRHGN